MADGVKAENTYAIKPHFRKKFKPDAVRSIIDEELKAKLENEKYHVDKAAKQAKEITDAVKKRLKGVPSLSLTVIVVLSHSFIIRALCLRAAAAAAAAARRLQSESWQRLLPPLFPAALLLLQLRQSQEYYLQFCFFCPPPFLPLSLSFR